MESALTGISVLLRYFDEKKEDLEDRLRKGVLLETNEIDAISDYCQINFRSKNSSEENSKNVISFYGVHEFDEQVSFETKYVRLTIIANYLKWLSEQLVGTINDTDSVDRIVEMVKRIKERRPVRKNRNSENDEKGLTIEQVDFLFEIFRPDSELNPFQDKSVRKRNRLIFLLLYHLGIRGGELLNIRIRDIDFSKSQIVIVRRADEKDDTRKYQPLVKTLDRRMPLKDTLIKELHEYVSKDRRKLPNAAKNDFLFITHKSGPTQGQPLSKSAYKKVVQVVRMVSPILFNLTGHQLRHTWNEVFSERMDAMDEPKSQETQEKMRSYLMGWQQGSGTAATYNKRFLKKQAQEAALKLQEGMVRTPKGIDNE
jgi:integrase